MVNSISGTLTFKSSEQLGVETGGIEWAIDTTAATLSGMPALGNKVRVYTYLHHTQDQMRMYGFSQQEERAMFRSLLTVSGVGPSLAKKILSGISTDRLRMALENEDLAALSAVPGLGNKTASKIVLHLRGTLAGPEDAEGKAREVIDALVAMGYEMKNARRVVTSLWNESEIASLSQEEREKTILRRAIVELSS